MQQGFAKQFAHDASKNGKGGDTPARHGGQLQSVADYIIRACTRSARCRRARDVIACPAGRRTEAFRVVSGPARRRDLEHAGVVKRPLGGIEVRVFPDGDQLGAPMVLVQVALATSTVLPTEEPCRPRRLAIAAPDDVVDLLVQFALRIEPALDDLDAVEIGADRVLQRGDEERRRLALRRLLKSPPIGTPLA